MKQQIKKRFDFSVDAALAIINKSFELDKNTTKVTGILMTSDREDLLYYRGTQKIELNAEEIVPEKYESKLLMSGLNASVNDRYYDVPPINVGNRILKIEYTDNASALAAFTAYRVSLYVECEVENQ